MMTEKSDFFSHINMRSMLIVKLYLIDQKEKNVSDFLVF